MLHLTSHQFENGIGNSLPFRPASIFSDMSTLVLDIEKQLPMLEPAAALHFERAVREMLLLAQRKESAHTVAGNGSRGSYRLPSRKLGARSGLDLTKLGHEDEEL